jgi:hypothetical protein
MKKQNKYKQKTQKQNKKATEKCGKMTSAGMAGMIYDLASIYNI